MKILFIVNIEDLGFEEPLGILYLSAVAKKNSHKVYAIENNFEKIKQEIRDIKPDLIALSVNTPNFFYLLQTAKKIKAMYNIPTIFGGPHITFSPEVVRDTYIDYGFRGECEEAFVEFLNSFEANKPVEQIQNIVFKEKDDSLRQNPLRSLIPNLDILPFPDRELLNNYKQFYEADIKTVMASRGCLYSCSYCCNKQYNELYNKGTADKMRLRSVDNAIGECLELKNIYKVKIIHFIDDIFPYQKNWLSDFADKYSKKIGLPFYAYTHFDVCTKEYVETLSKIGCNTLKIGIETADEILRERILHRKITNEMMLEKAKLIHSYGIKINTQNILGLPLGSYKKDLDTLKFNIDLKSDFSCAYLCQPYPKTEIAEIARKAGLIDDNCEFERSFYYSTPLRIPDKENTEKLGMLFALVVNFPLLYKYLPLLIKFPKFILKFVCVLFHGYKFKKTLLSYSMDFITFLRKIKMYFTREISSAFHGIRT